MTAALESVARSIDAGALRRERLARIARARFDISISTASAFFEENAGGISAAALRMAQRFERGGRLFVFGDGADATDAAHVSVEFVHPVIVGKRALPAIALTNDVATMTAERSSADGDGPFASMLRVMGRPGDIAFGIGNGIAGSPVGGALTVARSMGMLTLSSERASSLAGPSLADHAFLLPSGDPLVAQEVGETLYHVLWELVHLFLEHGSALMADAGGRDAPAASG